MSLTGVWVGTDGSTTHITEIVNDTSRTIYWTSSSSIQGSQFANEFTGYYLPNAANLGGTGILIGNWNDVPLPNIGLSNSGTLWISVSQDENTMDQFGASETYGTVRWIRQ
ncbi:hypothetical protein IC620_09760 [Hazenella sp. IB182357]|uniref:Uncharacterized protein n=1 Tax=Polycladospora coralii TaxID=2771432 RepID=A0A926NFK7_9BACL|nr:hypothetical protein [Polycladospora coralii]MBD1372639.1 hypothetical protein [Polycladospora coralii]MBS7531253.1 hypothetical protein [Polycladospora coralii]